MVILTTPSPTRLTKLAFHLRSKVSHIAKQNCAAVKQNWEREENLRSVRKRCAGGRLAKSCRVHSLPGVKISSNMSSNLQEVSAAIIRKPAPVLLVDVMGTVIRDPFYEDIPTYFGMTMKELLAQKHPTAWIEFETGQLTEDELLKKFFSDGRDFDLQGLKDCMMSGYDYLEGVEDLLQRLQASGYVMHALSNYPRWYSLIEDKLELSRYLPWTFVSCHMGLRKPDAKIYLEAAHQLKLDPSKCIFIDDRRKNVEAAMEVGMMGIVFQNAKQLEEELVAMGCFL